jgi:hypothetical protein
MRVHTGMLIAVSVLKTWSNEPESGADISNPQITSFVSSNEIEYIAETVSCYLFRGLKFTKTDMLIVSNFGSFSLICHWSYKCKLKLN